MILILVVYSVTMLSRIEHLARQCHRRWVPKWYQSFACNGRGLFHERLDHQFLPIDTGRQRLLTQCRQLAVYAHHLTTPHARGSVTADQLMGHFDAIKETFYVPETGGWRFSIGEGEDDPLYDLYAHAFIIFMGVWLYRATGDQAACAAAIGARDFIVTHFQCKNAPGYEEQLDAHLNPIAQIRRQDPHMHLLEAALFSYETWGMVADATLAHDCMALFKGYFWDETQQCLGEDYDAHLLPHPGQGDYCEPGHHFEWVWLLHKYESAFGHDAQLKAVRAQLWSFGNTTGYDTQYGGIYNAVTKTGDVIEDDKRIWPITEALKANAIMLDEVTQRAAIKKDIDGLLKILNDGYVHKRGFWTETLNRDLSAQTDYMPGTTPYHLYFGVMEALDILRVRGRSKSWRSALVAMQYNTRRSLSDCMRRITSIWKHKSGKIE